MGLGDLYLRENKPDRALECWERLLALDPSLVSLHAQVGNLHRKRLAFEKAEASFRAVLGLEPENPYGLFGLADVLRGQGRHVEAAPLWDAVLAVDPHNPQVLTRAGDCFARLGEAGKATRLFEQALTLGFHKPALLGLVRVAQDQGNHLEALRRCQELLAHSPRDSRALALLESLEAEHHAPPGKA